MALHKFTPGGCRQDCGSVLTECPCEQFCDVGTVMNAYNSFDVVYYESTNDAGCCVFRSNPFVTDICGHSGSYYEVMTLCGDHATVQIYRGSDDALVLQYGLVHSEAPTRNCQGKDSLGNTAYHWDGGAVISDCGYDASAASMSNASDTPVDCTSTNIPPNPNSCCPCEDCRLMRDYFNRTAGTDLGANWTETAGQWTLESPSRLATDDTSAIVLATTSSSAVGLAVTAKGSTGDKVRLIAGYQDSSNYFYAEFTWGSGLIEIYKRSGGTDTLLQTGTGTFPSGGFVRISLCIDGSGVVRAAGGAILVVAVSTAPTGSQFGLGTGGTNSGAVQFTVAEAYVVSATCEACPAIIEHVGCNPPINNCCQQEDEAYQYEVDLGAGGYVNDNCNNCAAVSGVFVLTRVGSDCTWRYDNDAFCPQTCSAGSPAGNWKLSITLQRGGPDNCRWQVGVLIYVPIGPQESCGNRLTMYFESTDPGTSAACAGTWTIPWQYTTTPGVLPCTGNLPATIGLASV